MANPQTGDGFTPIATEIVDAFCRYRISGEEWLVLWVIIRQTYGWRKKAETIKLSYFIEMTHLKKQSVQRAIKKLKEKNIIMVSKNAVDLYSTYCFNKDYDSWTPAAKKLSAAIKLPKLCNSGSNKAAKGDSKKLSTYKDTKDTVCIKDTLNPYNPLFEHWNSKGIIVHRKLTEKMERKIKTALKDYTEGEILQAIDNYATVVKSKEYYWTHQWTLEDFLARGLAKFIDAAHPLTNFLVKNKNAPQQPVKKWINPTTGKPYND
jgi:phage replication O-like protein O